MPLVHPWGVKPAREPMASTRLSPIWHFRLCTSALVLLTAPIALLVFIPGFVASLQQDSPLPLRHIADAFLPVFVLWVMNGSLTFAALNVGERVRGADSLARRAAVRWCLMLGIMIGALIYWFAGWGLPAVERRLAPSAYRVVSENRMLEAPPFVLTTGELLRVQRAFESAGGHSVRVAQTLELRAWLAAAAPVMSLVIAAAMLAPWPKRRLWRTLLAHAAGFAILCVAYPAAFGPAAFLRPPRLPLDMAWTTLGVLGASSGRVLAREWREPKLRSMLS